jgi:hypothetical protein
MSEIVKGRDAAYAAVHYRAESPSAQRSIAVQGETDMKGWPAAFYRDKHGIFRVNRKDAVSRR